MKFVALLRGINVGGKNVISMATLKKCLEQQDLQSVATYIQSGNVIFESGDKDARKLTGRIEAALSKRFGYDARIVLRSQPQLKAVVSGAPRDWKTRTDLRCYVAFPREPLSPAQALADVVVEPRVDLATAGKGVLYLTTALSGLNKSGFRKMIGKPSYQQLTIRNYSTCRRILALMEE